MTVLTSDPEVETSPGHPRRRRWVILVLATLIVAIAAGTGIGAAIWSGGRDPTATASPTALLVVDAANGYIQTTPNAELQLHLTTPSVLFFLDRPQRGSGRISAAKLVSNWQKAFGKAAPFGALVAAAGPDASTPAAFQITHPALGRDGTVTFDLAPDKGVSAAQLGRIRALSQSGASVRGRMTLFIDNASWRVADYEPIINDIVFPTMLPPIVHTCTVAPGAWCPGWVASRSVGPNLMNVSMAGANLATADFSGMLLMNVDLRGANLTRANLTGAVIMNVNLSGASMAGANLTGTSLEQDTVFGTNMTDANLTNSRWRDTPVAAAILKNATSTGADFG